MPLQRSISVHSRWQSLIDFDGSCSKTTFPPWLVVVKRLASPQVRSPSLQLLVPLNTSWYEISTASVVVVRDVLVATDVVVLVATDVVVLVVTEVVVVVVIEVAVVVVADVVVLVVTNVVVLVVIVLVVVVVVGQSSTQQLIIGNSYESSMPATNALWVTSHSQVASGLLMMRLDEFPVTPLQ